MSTNSGKTKKEREEPKSKVRDLVRPAKEKKSNADTTIWRYVLHT